MRKLLLFAKAKLNSEVVYATEYTFSRQCSFFDLGVLN